MNDPKSNPFFDVRMRGFPSRTEVADVLRWIDSRVGTASSEHISLSEAAGRVLAEGIVSGVNVPAFARSAMDGYALRGEETFGATPYNSIRLKIVGEALPARPTSVRVERGDAVRIMTGAPMPDGADAVLPAEAASEEGEAVVVVDPVAPGRNVGRVGEDVSVGQRLLAVGRWLRPQDLGLLASIGLSTVRAIRRPIVAILITGDELLPPGSAPDDYHIVDSNSVVLSAMIRRDGGLPLPTVYVRDRDEEASSSVQGGGNPLRNTLQNVKADVILISGGSSVGKEDHAPRLLAELGELSIHGVALRPASPTGIGFLSGRPVFLLPGNPVSCLCAYDLFAGRAIRRLGGLNPELPYRRVDLTLAAKIVSAVGRVDYVRVKIVSGGVEPIAISGASMLSTTVVADGFVLVERDSEGHAAGERIAVYLYDDVRA